MQIARCTAKGGPYWAGVDPAQAVIKAEIGKIGLLRNTVHAPRKGVFA